MANSLMVILRLPQRFSLISAATNLSSIITKGPALQVLAVRPLYSKISLGLNGFEQSRQQTKSNMGNITEKFKQKMKEYTADDSKNMIFTEDLKNMIHIAETEEDLQLIMKMMKKFNKQDKELRFGSFIFGPVAMRLFHLLNKPDIALEAFKDPELEGFFDQLISYQVLFDLLYENQKYQEMLDTFEIIKERQIEGTKYPRNIIVLVTAACYKLNSQESLKYILNLWKELSNVGHLPMRRAVTFTAGLALRQGNPSAAVEIVTTAKNQNYTTVRNLKALALAGAGRLEESILVLKSVLQEDQPKDVLQTFNKDVMDEIKSLVEKADSADVKTEFERVSQLLLKQGHISNTTMDEQLCSEIQSPAFLGKARATMNRFQPRRQQRQGFQDRSYEDRNYQDRNFRDRNYEDRNFQARRISQRPGLNDLN